MPSELGVRVFDVIHDILCRNLRPLREQPSLRLRPPDHPERRRPDGGTECERFRDDVHAAVSRITDGESRVTHD